MAEVGNAGQALLGLTARAVLAGVWLYAGLTVTDLDGSIRAFNYGTVLARDVLFLLAAAWLLWRLVTRWSVDAALARRTGQR